MNKKLRTIKYWCVPNQDAGYNRRFKLRKEAFTFWKDADKAQFSKPSKVEIEYVDVFDLVNNCLAGESSVSEPYFEEEIAA